MLKFVAAEHSSMRAVFLFVLISVLSGCQFCKEERSQDPFGCENSVFLDLDEETRVEHTEIIRILSSYGVKLKKEDRIFIEGAYAKYDEGQWWIWIDASSQKLVDLPRARYMMVDLVEGLLEELNGSYKINKEFTHNNLYVSIELESFFGQYVDLFYVGRMELKEGNFFAAYAHTAIQSETVYHHMHSEPYETSKIITRSERAADKRYKSPYSAFDDLVSPVDWQSGDPIEQKTKELYTIRSTDSNLPKSKTGVMLNEEDLNRYNHQR